MDKNSKLFIINWSFSSYGITSNPSFVNKPSVIYSVEMFSFTIYIEKFIFYYSFLKIKNNDSYPIWIVSNSQQNYFHFDQEVFPYQTDDIRLYAKKKMFWTNGFIRKYNKKVLRIDFTSFKKKENKIKNKY